MKGTVCLSRLKLFSHWETPAVYLKTFNNTRSKLKVNKKKRSERDDSHFLSAGAERGD